MSEFNMITGPINSVIDELKRDISSYQRKREKIKIGISVIPETRWAKHSLSQHEWDKMVVLYKSSSHDSICLAESMLIEYSKRKFTDKCQNINGGGSGINDPYLYKEFYLYILLK